MKPTQPTLSPYAEQVMTHTLQKVDEHGQHHSRLMENKLVKDNENAQHTHRLLEDNVEMQDRVVSNLKDIKDELARPEDKAPDVQKVSIEGVDIITIKGAKGDPGKDGTIGPAGRDGAIGPRGEQGIEGKVGPRGPAGKDGVSIIGPEGAQGKAGPKGATGPAGKDGVDASKDAELIASLINPHIDFTKIKGVPELKKGMWAGTGYLREISDVNTTGLQHGQVLIWNATTSKWEPGTPASSSSGGTPAGSDTQVQYNDNGAFGTNANFTVDKTTGAITTSFLTVKKSSYPGINIDDSSSADPYLSFQLNQTDKGGLYYSRGDDAMYTSYKNVIKSKLNSAGFSYPTQYASSKYTDVISSHAFAVDWTNGNVHYVLLENYATISMTLANPIDGGRYLLILKQPSSGSGKITSWDSNILWSGGTAPTLTATVNKVDLIALVYDGTNGKYYCTNSLNF